MPIKFQKVQLAAERYESAGVFDVDGDGTLDIVSGGFWYRGPDFTQRYRIGDVHTEHGYFDDFSTIPVDVNGDGRMDFITGGWFGGALQWRENPGDTKQDWPLHVIAKCGNIETARAWDVDRDGALEIVPNTPGHPLVVYKLKQGKVSSQQIYPGKQGHGLGFGDVSGKGLGDFVLQNGWLEAPDWKFHTEFDLGSASVPILVVDVNSDGLNDLIVGQAHGYGLDWWEQGRDAGGKRTWKKHAIDPFNSQYHDMQWVDLDGDGQCELVTGKRYLAHDYDPGAHDPLGIFYFKWTGESFSKQIIDYGPEGVGKGCGIHFAVADLRGTGRLDVVAPGKDGLCVFFNEGNG